MQTGHNGSRLSPALDSHSGREITPLGLKGRKHEEAVVAAAVVAIDSGGGGGGAWQLCA